ncbi:MAG: redoxin domain-containing protein, partial [Sphingomonadaceae bacterium]
MLEEGDKAPAVEVTTTAGNDIRLDAPGAPLVVYFYPKDMTPGCTTEAIDFSEHLAEFEAEGARVIGVSRDSNERHEKFIAKHDLT